MYFLLILLNYVQIVRASSNYVIFGFSYDSLNSANSGKTLLLHVDVPYIGDKMFKTILAIDLFFLSNHFRVLLTYQ